LLETMFCSGKFMLLASADSPSAKLLAKMIAPAIKKPGRCVRLLVFELVFLIIILPLSHMRFASAQIAARIDFQLHSPRSLTTPNVQLKKELQAIAAHQPKQIETFTASLHKASAQLEASRFEPRTVSE